MSNENESTIDAGTGPTEPESPVKSPVGVLGLSPDELDREASMARWMDSMSFPSIAQAPKVPPDAIDIARRIAWDNSTLGTVEIAALAVLAERERIEALLKDPAAVYVNSLRGIIDTSSVVQAELERCAKLAELRIDATDYDLEPEAAVAESVTAKGIADAIRRGEA